MSIDTLRAVITLVSFIAFLGIVAWAWSARRKGRFDEAARLPFADDDRQRATLEAEHQADDGSDLSTASRDPR